MPNKTWKASERQIAARFGSKRTGPQGKAVPDIITGRYSIEVKTRKAFPAWLHEAMAQSRRNAVDGTEPIVVLHQIGQRYDDDLVVMSLKMFQMMNEGRIG
jgi:hypothetical protein